MNLEIGHNYVLSITDDNGKVSYTEAVVMGFVQNGLQKLVRLREAAGLMRICRLQDIQVIEEKGVSLNE